MLKESQYINEDIGDDKLSNIVSGALDRLHYEDDPCVKYYSDKKIWIYLHKDRFLYFYLEIIIINFGMKILKIIDHLKRKNIIKNIFH